MDLSKALLQPQARRKRCGEEGRLEIPRDLKDAYLQNPEACWVNPVVLELEEQPEMIQTQT